MITLQAICCGRKVASEGQSGPNCPDQPSATLILSDRVATSIGRPPDIDVCVGLLFIQPSVSRSQSCWPVVCSSSIRVCAAKLPCLMPESRLTARCMISKHDPLYNVSNCITGQLGVYFGSWCPQESPVTTGCVAQQCQLPLVSFAVPLTCKALRLASSLSIHLFIPCDFVLNSLNEVEQCQCPLVPSVNKPENAPLPKESLGKAALPRRRTGSTHIDYVSLSDPICPGI